MGTYRFEDLEAWKKGREFRKEISKLCKTLPKEEKFRLIDQLIRASRSITANIAEGHGRYHYQENIQFCRTSRGSLDECKDHLITAFDEEYIQEFTLNEFLKRLEELLRILNGYILYLKKPKGGSKN